MHNSEKKKMANAVITILQTKCGDDIVQVRRVLRCAIEITNGVIKSKEMINDEPENETENMPQAERLEQNETENVPEADSDITNRDGAGGKAADSVE